MSPVLAFWHNADDFFDWLTVAVAYALVVGVFALPVIVIVRYARRARSSRSELEDETSSQHRPE